LKREVEGFIKRSGGRRGKMVEIECLLCEKPIKLPKYIDTENYDGEVVCQECESLLYIKLVKGKLQKRRVKQKGFRRFSAEEMASLFKILAEKRKELLAEERKREEK